MNNLEHKLMCLWEVNCQIARQQTRKPTYQETTGSPYQDLKKSEVPKDNLSETVIAKTYYQNVLVFFFKLRV